MSKMFLGSIDLNKIDKNRIVKFDKNGKRFENNAQYYPIVVWINDEISEFGSIGNITDSISKEEKASGVKATTIAWLKNPPGQNVKTENEKTENEKTYQEHEDDLPF